MQFADWKQKIFRLFEGEIYLVPSNDWLFTQWEAGESPEQVATLIRQLS
jgi:hypothetical protein